MRIIPAIDIIAGKCVRLTQGDYSRKTVYSEDPVTVAKGFADAGLRYLHLVDLDGAKAGKVVNWKTVEAITANTSLVVDFGGGIKTEKEVSTLLELGVQQINVGSLAVKDPDEVASWIRKFGSDKVILSADTRNEMVSISGWQESSSISLFDLIESFIAKKLSYVTCTDISTDGMLSGPNVNLYRRLLEKFPTINLTASGGVSSIADLEELRSAGVYGAIVGKAYYEGRVSLSELADLVEP